MTFGFLSHLDLNLYLFRLPVMKMLVAQGHKVYAICPKGEVFESFKEHGIEAVAYNIQRQSLNPLKELKSIYNVYKVLKPLHIDLLHTFTIKPNLYGTIAGKLCKIKHIVNLVEGLGSFYTHATWKYKVVRFIMESAYRFVFRLSNRCVFVSHEDMAYFIQRHLIHVDKAVLIHGVGIDTDYFNAVQVDENKIHSLKRELGLGEGTIVLMIARAIFDKGIKEFYAAAEQFDRRDIQCILVGDMDSANPSCASKEFLTSGKVHWLGHRDDIRELIAMSDMVILPSYREGLPRTLLEASSMGKPVIATDTSGCREVVDDGVTGFLIPVRSSDALAEKIIELDRAPRLCQDMGENGRKKVQQVFDINIVLQQYRKLYGEFADV